jgi:hypothetical protein
MKPSFEKASTVGEQHSWQFGWLPLVDLGSESIIHPLDCFEFCKYVSATAGSKVLSSSHHLQGEIHRHGLTVDEEMSQNNNKTRS